MITDCAFTKENKWFRYRAGAIIIENGCVLFAKNELDPYLYSVGGGIHHGETSEEAVKREVFEETGVHYEIDRLAFIHENFFTGSGRIEDMDCHEISFYYLMKPRGSQQLGAESADHTTDTGIAEHTCWIPIEKLGDYTAFPLFLRDEIFNLDNNTIKHIVTNDNCTS